MSPVSSHSFLAHDLMDMRCWFAGTNAPQMVGYWVLPFLCFGLLRAMNVREWKSLSGSHLSKVVNLVGTREWKEHRKVQAVAKPRMEGRGGW